MGLPTAIRNMEFTKGNSKKVRENKALIKEFSHEHRPFCCLFGRLNGEKSRNSLAKRAFYLFGYLA
jgi:hypothetical protein